MKLLGLKLETELFESGYSVVIGCDEVGRGALAGPVVAGAVAISAECKVLSAQLKNAKSTSWISKIQDSKLLSKRQREELEIHIKHNALAWGVGVVSCSVIDKINIHQANLLAMERAVRNLVSKLSRVARTDKYLSSFLLSRPESASWRRSGGIPQLEDSLGMTDKELKHQGNIYLLIDGKFTLPEWAGKQAAVVDGDAKIFSIASASIIAKVYRDRLMMKLDKEFPGYELARHKGYGTSAHRKAIVKKGMCKIHRKTFCKNIDAWRSKTV